jgi:hypothetical protein
VIKTSLHRRPSCLLRLTNQDDRRIIVGCADEMSLTLDVNAHQKDSGGVYYFLGKGAFRTFDKWHVAISIGLIALMSLKG